MSVAKAWGLLACVASVPVCFKRKENSARVLAARKMGRAQKMKREGGRKESLPLFPPPPRFIFCALPIFRAAKTRTLADLDRFLGFPFAKNAQERLLRRLGACITLSHARLFCI